MKIALEALSVSRKYAFTVYSKIRYHTYKALEAEGEISSASYRERLFLAGRDVMRRKRSRNFFLSFKDISEASALSSRVACLYILYGSESVFGSSLDLTFLSLSFSCAKGVQNQIEEQNRDTVQ